MSGGAVIAAAAAARRRALNRVLDVFRVAGATSADRARTLTTLGLAPDPAIEMLMESGVLKPGAARDAWYLDEAAYVAHRDAGPGSRRVRVIIAIGVLMLILGIVLAVLTSAPHPAGG